MPKRRPFEAQLVRLSLASSVPVLLVLLWVMIDADVSIWLTLLAAFIGIALIAYTAYRIHEKSVYQFRRLSNLLDAMIEGDYSLRARSDQAEGALDELVLSINGLAERLNRQRTESVESQLLVRTVIEHIDVAIVALSEHNRISFLNPAAEELLRIDRDEASAELLDQLAFVQSLPGGHQEVVELSLGNRRGRFNIHVREFREAGKPRKLLFITDVGTLLRSEERKAWQNLVRVISHEINNSLSPIASISQTLKRAVGRRADEAAMAGELTEGLSIIAERADGLKRFVDSYKQLTRLPDPRKELVSIVELVERSRVLFNDIPIVIESDDDVQLFIDPVQFEQVLINLFKNAVEAMSKTGSGGRVNVGWSASGSRFNLTICDQGGGIANPDNLFVPFYSTKQHGTGIGLVLCRQIVEAHNGRLSITNRADASGCCASIEIPLDR